MVIDRESDSEGRRRRDRERERERERGRWREMMLKMTMFPAERKAVWAFRAANHVSRIYLVSPYTIDSWIAKRSGFPKYNHTNSFEA
jgi:hypothetical protein